MDITIFEEGLQIECEHSDTYNLCVSLNNEYKLLLNITKRPNDITVTGKSDKLYKLVYHLTRYYNIQLF